VSLKVNTPHPRRARSQAPKETRSQRGSCYSRACYALVSCYISARTGDSSRGGLFNTYNWDNVLLDGGGEGNKLKVQEEVELDHGESKSSVSLRLEFQITLLRVQAGGGGGIRHTELTRSAIEMVCCARVMMMAGAQFSQWAWAKIVKATLGGSRIRSCFRSGDRRRGRGNWVGVIGGAGKISRRDVVKDTFHQGKFHATDSASMAGLRGANLRGLGSNSTHSLCTKYI
jgi:hypothetical protein